jgi:hypothetical protein
MINFRVTNADTGSLAIFKPWGQSIPLTRGEVVAARIIDVSPSGEVTLHIKGGLLTAKTEIQVQMQKDMNVLFKVLETPMDGGELKLQFLGVADKSVLPQPQADPKAEALTKLIAELSNALSKTDGTLSAKTLEGLLKALPQDTASLPKEVRNQLQTLLQTSLKTAGQSIQGRLEAFFNRELPAEIQNHPLVQNLKSEMMLNIDKLLTPALKSALQDTGVALEAKLKNVADMLFKMDGEKLQTSGLQKDLTVLIKGMTSAATDDPGDLIGLKELTAFVKDIKETVVEKDAARDMQKTREDPLLHKDTAYAASKDLKDSAVNAAIKNDLKAGLLQLKELLTEKGADLFAKAAATNRGGQTDVLPLKALQQNIDGLLKDIQTFQSLSRATDSFYTFLPVNWKGLKDGEIAFKKGQDGGKGTPFSCRINLDLAGQGKLNVLILMQGKEFFVTFKAEDKKFQETIGSHLKELQDSFREKGLYLKGTTILDFKDPSFEQLDQLGPVDRLVSIKA